MLNCGHHNHAGLIEFDLIMGGLVHDHDDIYEIEGVNELIGSNQGLEFI